MRTHPCRRPHACPTTHGSTLAVTLILLSIISFGLFWMSRAMLEHQFLLTRKGQLLRAYYAAEAGIDLVKDWGNRPEAYTPDPTLFARVIPTPPPFGGGSALVNINAHPEEIFPSLAARLAAGGLTVDEDDLAAMGVGRFVSDHEYAVGQIERVELLPVTAGDPVASFFKIVSTGRSPRGIRRRVQAYIDVNPVLRLRVPAALLSYNTAAAFGNARIHWGESWAKATFNMLNKSQMDYLKSTSSNYDPWAKYRTEGSINFPTNWQVGAGKDLASNYTTLTQPGAGDASGAYANAFYQHLPPGTLQWPVFDYQTFKELAVAHGRYYSTDAAGNIYRDGIEDAAHRVDFLTEFGVADRARAPFDLIFIDTIDGQPPAADGSNLATISASGNSLGIKGVFWIGANFDGSGVGSPPSLVGRNPNGTPANLEKIFLDGVLYTAGTTALGGNAGVYGSVIAQRGFTGGGTPDIYYNSALANGLELANGNIGSIFKVSLQKNF